MKARLLDADAIKARLVSVLMGEMLGVPEKYARDRRDAYERMCAAELIDLLDRRLTAAQARANSIRDALRLVVSSGELPEARGPR